MTSFNVYRSVNHSILIKRLLLAVDAIDRETHKWTMYRERLGALIPSWDVIIKALPWTTGKLWEREGWKTVRFRDGSRLQGKSDFLTQQDWCQYQLTERVTACTYLYRFKSNKIPSLRRASWYKFLPLTNNLLAFDTCCQKENQISSLECHWFY